MCNSVIRVLRRAIASLDNRLLSRHLSHKPGQVSLIDCPGLLLVAPFGIFACAPSPFDHSTG